jgi:hypothetical protein
VITVDGAEFPAASNATALIVCDPVVTFFVFQLTA